MKCFSSWGDSSTGNQFISQMGGLGLCPQVPHMPGDRAAKLFLCSGFRNKGLLVRDDKLDWLNW